MSIRTTTALAALITVGACTPPALAQQDDDSLEEIIVVGKQQSYFEKARKTAMKMEADDLETPFSLSVLNATMLEDLKANTLEDAYGYISGFSRSGTNANSFTIRGLSADLQNIQVDGLPGLVSRFGSPVTANIERVEVLKGPASVLYGWMDPGGMLNIVTKKPQAETYRSVDVTYQHFIDQNEGGLEGSIDLTGPLNDDGTIMYRLVAGGETEDSFRNYVEEDTLYFYPSLAFQLSDKTRLDLQFEYTKEDRSGDDGLFVLNQDLSTIAPIETYYQEPGDSDNDKGYAFSLSLEHQASDNLTASFRWRSVFHEDERDLYESNAVRPDNTLRRRNRNQYNNRKYHFFDANVNYHIDGAIEQNILAGVNGGYEYRQYDRLAFDTRGANVDIYDPVYTGQILEDDPGNFRKWNLYNVGAYLFDRFTINEHLTLVAGVRFDYQEGDYEYYYLDNDDTGEDETNTSSTNFNGGIVYRVNDRLSLYASYAQSFNPQTVATYDQHGDQLDPEQGEQFEAGVKLAALDGRLNLNAAWFDISKENVVENNGDYNELVGKITSNGIEVNLQYQATDTLQFQGGYTYVDAEVAETFNEDALNNVPAFAPAHSAFLWMRYNYPREVLGGLLGASLGVRYESDRFTDEESSKRVLLPEYTVVDAALYYERNRMKYAVNIANLTNKVYYTGGSNDYKIYPAEPLKISLSARIDF